MSNLRAEYTQVGLELAPYVTELRGHQEEAVEWVQEREEPFLFINAPTGSGKTLIGSTVGVRSNMPFTYAVHTIMLQNQVADTFENMPVFIGRGNFPCLIGDQTHPLSGKEVTAADAICAMPNYDSGDCDHDRSAVFENQCPYFQQNFRAMSSRFRTVNYALLLNYPPLVRLGPRSPQWMTPTRLLVCDEAHNVESAVCDAVSISLSIRTFNRMGIKLPKYTDVLDWAAWAKDVRKGMKWKGEPDRGFATAINAIETLSILDHTTAGHWMLELTQYGVTFMPVWGSPFVTAKLMGQERAPEAGTLAQLGASRGVQKAVFTSATLMGAEYVAEILGLEDGSWAYLDMPSVFPPENRPINYSPVMKMNAAEMSDPESRMKMQHAVDDVVQYYVLAGKPWGIIHAVSNKYRDLLLTESRWREIMTSDPAVHAAHVAENKASVLVAANLTEGWDGKDDLARFVIMPKVPYANLGDKRTSLRREEDPRSYDYHALVAVVQGAGRGVRHETDTADTWILDAAWQNLWRKRKSWLPQSFRDAYHHNVQLPSI